MILKLLYIGFAVECVDQTRRTFQRLFGLPGARLEPDLFLGTDKGACIPFPNGCWLYVMESVQAESPIYQYIEERGPGLERVAFLTDDIEAEFARARRGGVPLKKEAIVDTPWGKRFVVPPQYASGIAVELLQPRPGSWVLDVLDQGQDAERAGVLGLQHIGVAVRSLEATCDIFSRLFNLNPRELRTDQHYGEQKDVMIEPGNDRLWLHITESWGKNARVRQFLDEKGEGLEHICIEVDDISKAVIRVTQADVPIFNHKIYTDRPDGLEAFIYPEHSGGVTVELIEPYPTSRGYRPRTGRPESSIP